MTRRFIIRCDMSEQQIERDVPRYFGLISHACGENYRLTSSREGQTGGDAEFHHLGTVYFVQFKAPIGLESAKRVPIAKQKEREAYQAVRRFRETAGLRDDPHSLCFGLRKPSKPGKELQHNILMRYELAPHMRAFYVAPTILMASEYEAKLDDRRMLRLMDFPFYRRREQWVFQRDVQASLIAEVPFLRAHVSIVPHAHVETHEHHYSYSRHGNDVAFHSPEVLEGGNARLSDFLADDFPRLASPDRLLPVRELASLLYERAPQDVQETLGPPRNGDNSMLPWLRKHGALLRERYDISQYLFTADKS